MNTQTNELSKNAHQLMEDGANKAHQMLSKAADKADQVIDATKDTAADAQKAVQGGIDHLREAVPSGLSRAAHQAEDLARAGIDKARAAGQSVAKQAIQLRDQTVSYVREEPTKALLMAVAAGAVATLLIGWANRGNGKSNR